MKRLKSLVLAIGVVSSAMAQNTRIPVKNAAAEAIKPDSTRIPSLDSLVARGSNHNPPVEANWLIDMGAVMFMPDEQLKADIDRFCNNMDDSRLLDVEKAIWESDRAQTVWLMLAFIARSKNPHAGEVLQRYDLYLKLNPTVVKGYPPDPDMLIHRLDIAVYMKGNDPMKPDYWFSSPSEKINEK